MKFSDYLNSSNIPNTSNYLNEGLFDWIKTKFLNAKEVKKSINSLQDAFARSHLSFLLYNYNLLSVTLGSSMHEIKDFLEDNGGNLSTFKHTLTFGVPEELSDKKLSKILDNPVKFVKDFIAKNLVDGKFLIQYSRTLGQFPVDCDLKLDFELEGDFEDKNKLKAGITKILERNFQTSETLGDATLNVLADLAMKAGEVRGVKAPAHREMVNIVGGKGGIAGIIVLHCFHNKI